MSGQETTIVAIDHGMRRIGMAVANPLGIILPLPTVVLDEGEDSLGEGAIQRVVDAIRGQGADEVVVGDPKHHLTASSDRCSEFARRLRAALGPDTPVHMQDEALSSWEGEQQIRSGGDRRYDKARIDAAAARIILRDFIARRTGEPAEPPPLDPPMPEKERRRARRDAGGRKRKGGRGRGRDRDHESDEGWAD